MRSAGEWTQLGDSYPSGPLAAGTQLRLVAIGSTISFLEDGLTRISVTDTALSGGAPGIVSFGAATADNWSGGNTSTGSYSVGGTVSGLTGTVLLQNNGGDDLSVSSDGPFAFDQLLTDGEGYGVTVERNPDGQTCSVDDGSGSVAAADVTTVMVSCTTGSTTGSDDFNRVDGGLGSGWTDFGEGGLSISSQQVVGSSGTAGDIRTGESYAGDQFSQIELTSTQLSGGQWIGPAVRAQAGGQSAYAGIYFWNNGSPQLRLYVRSAGEWTQLGDSYPSGPLAAGTELRLVAIGSTISFLEDGLTRISVTDTALSGGAPGIVSFGAATADNWSGGNTSTGSYSVGGTVSGLTGTVLLQNNGGDDLSVSSDGPFAFDQLLTDGEGYGVTVERNPDGQTCSVDDGSGSVAAADVTTVMVSCTTGSTTGSDDFNRVDGGLGSGWTDFGEGGLSISSQQVVGSSGTAGDIRTGESYAGDQFSQIELTSTQLSGGQWIGPAVRAQAGGQSAYAGIYFWNNGSPQLRLYVRSAGEWTQLGDSYPSGPLAAGTQLRLVAIGSTISFLEDGLTRISVTDTALSGGAPGIVSFGAATADNWSGGPKQDGGTSGGTPGTKITYVSTDADGIATYDVSSPDEGPAPMCCAS